jgi:hypothetical protein
MISKIVDYFLGSVPKDTPQPEAAKEELRMQRIEYLYNPPLTEGDKKMQGDNMSRNAKPNQSGGAADAAQILRNAA